MVWGAGEHTKYLFELSSISNLDIINIVDQSEAHWGNSIGDIKIISPDCIKDQEFDMFLISSYAYRDEIRKTISKLYPEKPYIDIYEDDYKIHTSSFYVYDYYNLQRNYEIYNKYKSEKNLLNIIKELLYIRDIISAKEYIKSYINKSYGDYRNMIDFLEELNQLLEELKKEIEYKEQNNLIYMVTDALGYEEFEKYMAYTKKFAEQNIYFNNAFSPSTYTTESHKSIFTGKQLFEDEIYKYDKVNKENSKFIRRIKEKQYDLHSYDFLKLLDRDEFKFYGNSSFSPISKVLWDFTCSFLEWESANNFSYLRFMESHIPFNSGYSSFIDEKINGYEGLDKEVRKKTDIKKYINAVKYIDLQFKFYFQFIKKKDILVLFSDHGNGYFDKDGKKRKTVNETYNDDRIKVPLIIKSRQEENLVIDKIFNTKDLGSLLLELEEFNRILIPENEYIVIERGAIYNQSLKKTYKDNGYEKQTQAWRIIRTNIDKHITYQDKTEEYYLLSDEDNNLIKEAKYEERIDFFRNLEDNKSFPDF